MNQKLVVLLIIIHNSTHYILPSIVPIRRFNASQYVVKSSHALNLSVCCVRDPSLLTLVGIHFIHPNNRKQTEEMMPCCYTNRIHLPAVSHQS